MLAVPRSCCNTAIFGATAVLLHIRFSVPDYKFFGLDSALSPLLFFDNRRWLVVGALTGISGIASSIA